MPQVSALGIEERRVKVTVESGKDGIDYLKSGYDADIRFVTYSHENAVTVPKNAIFEDGGSEMVWIIKNGILDNAVIVKGVELRTEFVVDSGLAEGDIILPDANIDGIKKGMRVKVE